MTKASDNEYPSVLFDEQAGDPSTPASGFWRLYAKATGLFIIDDAASVTGPFGAGGGGIDSGTSFPGSPSTDDLFHRTDRDLIYFYDGTRWLTINEYSVDTAVLDTLFPITTTANNSYGATYQGANGAYITRAEFITISIANDGTHFHTCQLKSRVAAGTTTNLGSSFATNADTPGNNVRHSVTVGAVLGASDQQFLTTYTRSGTNSSIYVSATVFYRLIG